MAVLLNLASLTFVLYGALASTPYNPCDNNKNPIDLRVSGCDKLPCDFVKGTDVVAEMDFLVENDTKILKPEVKANALNLTVDYPIEEQDACKSLTNGECPLDQGEEVTYLLKMNISPQYPTIDLTVQLSLIDEHGSTLACFRLPARVVSRGP